MNRILKRYLPDPRPPKLRLITIVCALPLLATCSNTPNSSTNQAQIEQVQASGFAAPPDNTVARINDARPVEDAIPRIEAEHYPETAPEALGGVVAGALPMVFEKVPELPTTRAQWLEAFKQAALHSAPTTIAFFRVETLKYSPTLITADQSIASVLWTTAELQAGDAIRGGMPTTIMYRGGIYDNQYVVPSHQPWLEIGPLYLGFFHGELLTEAMVVVNDQLLFATQEFSIEEVKEVLR